MPAKDDSVEFGPNRLHKLRVEEVLAQTEGAPITGTHTAQTCMGVHSHGGKFDEDVFAGSSSSVTGIRLRRWHLVLAAELKWSHTVLLLCLWQV